MDTCPFDVSDHRVITPKSYFDTAMAFDSF